MSKLDKSAVTVGNEANAKALRELADKMEHGSVSAYAVVVLENKGFKIDVTMKSGVMEHDEGMYLALIEAMERQWMDCIARKKQMLEPSVEILQ